MPAVEVVFSCCAYSLVSFWGSTPLGTSMNRFPSAVVTHQKGYLQASLGKVDCPHSDHFRCDWGWSFGSDLPPSQISVSAFILSLSRSYSRLSHFTWAYRDGKWVWLAPATWDSFLLNICGPSGPLAMVSVQINQPIRLLDLCPMPSRRSYSRSQIGARRAERSIHRRRRSGTM